MTLNELKEALRSLTMTGLSAIAGSSFGIEGCRRAIAYYDTQKDEVVTALASFLPAVEALAGFPAVSTLFGSGEARRIAIQFVFNACRHLGDSITPETAFEQVWDGFARELNTPTWTFAAVANVQNIQCSEERVDLVDGISIVGRSFKKLGALLNWGPPELDYLGKDWMEGGGKSSFVLIVQTQVPKTPENFLLTDDGTAYLRATRALLALRLLAPGDVRIGRLFVTRPASFDVGIGGMQFQGFTAWNIGPAYRLVSDQVPQIRQQYENLAWLEANLTTSTRSLVLALRSFSSIYDRHFHQAEDRILDALTALEALWKLDQELAFRMAFRTASLLATTDDERVEIYEKLTQYYRIRSKIVHGSALNDRQARLVAEDEPLRMLVRRALRAFIHLATNAEEWTPARLDKEVDRVLQHTGKRTALQAAMGIVPSSAT